jgi:D-3-phosphoglycerate dehydrogenase
MRQPLIAVADSPFPSLDPVKAALAQLDPELRLAASAAPEDILAVARDADALIVCYAQLDGALVRQLTRCKVIGRTGLGVDNIDLPAARERGITVTYVPDYCLHEVSDHALALLLALARKIAFANQTVQSGRWEMPAVVPIRRLRGQVLGLVGFGHIPRLVAPKAQAFGLTVVACDPYVAPDVLAAAGVEGVSFDRLCEISDIVSVHAPLLPMKRGVLIVNTARGPLIDAAALVAALDAGQVGGAALDVLPVEPPERDSPLLHRDNVILTPHIGFYSFEALAELQTKAATGIARVLRGEKPLYPIGMA